MSYYYTTTTRSLASYVILETLLMFQGHFSEAFVVVYYYDMQRDPADIKAIQ